MFFFWKFGVANDVEDGRQRAHEVLVVLLPALHHVVLVQERAGYTPSPSAGTPAGRPLGWPLVQPLERSALSRVFQNTQW